VFVKRTDLTLSGSSERWGMRRKQFIPDKVIALLCQAEVEPAEGKRIGEAGPGTWRTLSRVTITGAVGTLA